MNNLDPELLHGQATYVSGRHKPLYMMQGLEAGTDVVFMVGYHGSISGESSILSHTYNPSVVSHVTLNGVRVGGVLHQVTIGGDDPLAMFRSFVAVTYITRQSEGR
jgi:D-amino peptidase